MASIWGVGNAPEATHLLIAIFFALGFAPARFLLNSFVYKRLAMRMLYGPAVPLMADVTRKSKFIKCTESMWKLTYYASVQMWVISILKQTPWAMNTKEYFSGWPNQDLRLPIKLFYMCQCGFYLYSIGALLAWETRRKDFSIMFSHHIITSVLIGYSYLSREIGGVAMGLAAKADYRSCHGATCWYVVLLGWICLAASFWRISDKGLLWATPGSLDHLRKKEGGVSMKEKEALN